MTYLLSKGPTTTADFIRFGYNVFSCPAVTALETFIVEELDLPHTLTEIGIGDSRFAKLAQKATKGGIIKGNRDLNAEDVMAIYQLGL